MLRFAVGLVITISLAGFAFADEGKSDTAQWEKKYQQLLEARPEIRRKVESGGATKAQVIAWMKSGGDKPKNDGGKRYYGAKIDVKDPAGFRKAQEAPIYSGPQPGERLPAFQAIGLRGETKGKELNPLAMAGDKPLVLIFQDNSVVGQKGLLLCGDTFARIAEKSPQGLHVSTTFLVDDPTLSEIFEYDFMDKINDVVRMSVSQERRDGPGAYGLNRNVAMTIIIAKKGKVLHNFALKQPMLYPDPYVLGAIAEAIEVEPTRLTSWFQQERKYDEAKSGKTNKQETKKQTPKKAAADRDRKKQVEREAPADERGRESEAKRTGEERRREYGRGRTEVKDPAKFKTAGKAIYSGPQPGEKLPPLTVARLDRAESGEQIDLLAKAGDQPQVILFQDSNGVAIRGLFGVGKLLAKLRDKSESEVHVSVVFLDDDLATFNRYAQLFPRLREMGVNITASKDGRDGPGAYGLNRNVAQTIILAKDGKVTRNFVFPQGMLYPDPHVLGGVAELLGKDRETVAAWLTEEEPVARAAMRSDRSPAAGDANAFREKLGQFVRAGKLTRAEAGELYRLAFPEPDAK